MFAECRVEASGTESFGALGVLVIAVGAVLAWLKWGRRG